MMTNCDSRYHRILFRWTGERREKDVGRVEGVVSSIVAITDLMRPLGELPDGIYLQVLGRFRSLLHELRVRLVEIFRSNCERYKIRYKLDIADDRLTLLEELKQEVYKLTPRDLEEIHFSREKEETLEVDKVAPVLEKAQSLALSEEEKFLTELNSKLKSNLEKLTLQLMNLESQVSKVDKQLQNVNENSNSFLLDAIETFRKWSENAKGVIRAVERAS